MQLNLVILYNKGKMKMFINDRVGTIVPAVIFKTRVRDDSIAGSNPFRWQDVTSYDYFGGKRVILFSLPGAFTPTCDTYQLPGFESNYDKFKELGIGEIYCMSVNDAFVMNAWAKSQNLKNVKVVPDGSGEFTQEIDMLVAKDNLGFGLRSWRYAAIINNGVIEAWFEEEGKQDNATEDPYQVTSPENILAYLRAKEIEKERD
jgi:peroxiredoxin